MRTVSQWGLRAFRPRRDGGRPSSAASAKDPDAHRDRPGGPGRSPTRGSPFATGTVQFVPQEGPPGLRGRSKDGHFILTTYQEEDGAVPGLHQVGRHVDHEYPVERRAAIPRPSTTFPRQLFRLLGLGPRGGGTARGGRSRSRLISRDVGLTRVPSGKSANRGSIRRRGPAATRPRRRVAARPWTEDLGWIAAHSRTLSFGLRMGFAWSYAAQSAGAAPLGSTRGPTGRMHGRIAAGAWLPDRPFYQDPLLAVPDRRLDSGVSGAEVGHAPRGAGPRSARLTPMAVYWAGLAAGLGRVEGIVAGPGHGRLWSLDLRRRGLLEKGRTRRAGRGPWRWGCRRGAVEPGRGAMVGRRPRAWPGGWSRLLRANGPDRRARWVRPGGPGGLGDRPGRRPPGDPGRGVPARVRPGRDPRRPRRTWPCRGPRELILTNPGRAGPKLLHRPTARRRPGTYAGSRHSSRPIRRSRGTTSAPEARAPRRAFDGRRVRSRGTGSARGSTVGSRLPAPRSDCCSAKLALLTSDRSRSPTTRTPSSSGWSRPPCLALGGARLSAGWPPGRPWDSPASCRTPFRRFLALFDGSPALPLDRGVLRRRPIPHPLGPRPGPARARPGAGRRPCVGSPRDAARSPDHAAVANWRFPGPRGSPGGPSTTRAPTAGATPRSSSPWPSWRSAGSTPAIDSFDDARAG